MVALTAACGQTGAHKEAPTPSPVFVYCPQASPSYLLVVTPGSDCRELVAGKDYADGRVIIGVRDGTSDADLQGALVAYHATVLGSNLPAAQRLLQVPAGTVPEAVVGLARYPFVTFAQPDLLQHPDQSVT
jgi:hypothetical protein